MSRHRLCVPLTIVVGLGLMCLSWLRHVHFGSHAYDLGAYENLFFNLGHSGVPYNAVERTHQWGNHFEIGLLWLYLPYRWAPSPLWLFALQSGAVAASALPIEAIARRRLKDARAALVIACCVWLTPQLILANLYDFHATTLCALPVAGMLYGIELDRPRAVFLSALACLSLREPLALAVAAAGAAWVLRHGRERWRHGALLALVGTAIFLLEVLVIIPHFAEGGGFKYVSQYGRLGGSPGAALRFLVEHPLRFAMLPFEGDRPLYLLSLSAGTAPLWLWALTARKSAWPLLVAAPLLLVQLLNDRWEVWNVNFHYGSVVVPCLVMAALLAVARLRGRAREVTPWLWLLATLIYGLPFAVIPKLVGPTGPLRFAPHPARWEALAMVPDEVSVCAQQDLLPHLADRPVVHPWPRCDPSDRFLVLDATGMQVDAEARAALGPAIEQLRSDPSLVVRFDRDGAFVAERR